MKTQPRHPSLQRIAQVVGCTVFLASITAMLTSCATTPATEVEAAASAPAAYEGGTKPGKLSPPAESEFVSLSISVPTETGSYPTWRTKSPGQPLLLLHPVNGLSPVFLHFALELEKWGYRVYLPSLYGEAIDGEPAYGFDNGLAMIGYLKDDPRWNPVALDTLGQIVDDVAAMARSVSRQEGGRRVAVLGHSLTGMIPLAILDEPAVGLAVLAQPATPVRRLHEILFRIPQSEEEKVALSVSDEDWARIAGAMQSHPRKRIAGFHYQHDPMATIESFDALQGRLEKAGLAGRFTAYVLSRAGEPYAAGREDWVVESETSERAKMLTPHSTYVVPENDRDREWFRARLRETLAHGW